MLKKLRGNWEFDGNKLCRRNQVLKWQFVSMENSFDDLIIVSMNIRISVLF